MVNDCHDDRIAQLFTKSHEYQLNSKNITVKVLVKEAKKDHLFASGDVGHLSPSTIPDSSGHN